MNQRLEIRGHDITTANGTITKDFLLFVEKFTKIIRQ